MEEAAELGKGGRLLFQAFLNLIDQKSSRSPFGASVDYFFASVLAAAVRK
jgi:hypothetical protein